jgi:gamma-glutamyl:cysteine ligase YbdK (ATP-grasp superfamily)
MHLKKGESMAKQTELSDFLAKFNFDSSSCGQVGIERERFLATQNKTAVPRSKDFLMMIDEERWIYELSACQIEDRVGPKSDLLELKLELLANDNHGQIVAKELGLEILAVEFLTDLPLDVYDNIRYRNIVKDLPRYKLLAACQVAGVHLHFGAKNIEEAIDFNNELCGHFEELCRIGDHSQGKRLAAYRQMAPDFAPRHYVNQEHFFDTAREQRYDENPRNCWHLIRISIHGTVELRMFGSTSEIDEILTWIEFVKNILQRRN